MRECAFLIKAGNQETAVGKSYLGLKHGDPIALIDTQEWDNTPLEEIVGIRDRIAFLVIKFDPAQYATVQTYIEASDSMDLGDPEIDPATFRVRSKRLVWQRLKDALDNQSIEDDVLANGQSVDIQDLSSIDITTLFDDASLFPDNSVEDVNAVTSGTYTVGSGKDYSTLSSAIADLGNLTGDLTFRVESDFSDASQPLVTEDLGSYKFTITSDIYHSGNFNEGRVVSVATGSMHYLTFSNAGSGEIVIESLNLKKTADSPPSYGIILVTNTTSFTGTITIRNNLINGNGYECSGLYPHDPDPKYLVYSNIITGCRKYSTQPYSGMGMFIKEGSSSDYYEHNVVHNCQDVGLYIEGNLPINVINCYCCDNHPSDYSGTAASSTFAKCASSDGSGSEASLRNLTTSNEVESTTISDGSSFFLPKKTGNLLDGIIPDYASQYINGNNIITPVWIGAKGVSVFLSYFNNTSVVLDETVLSLVDKDSLVYKIQSDSTDTYFDSTSKLNLVQVEYSHEDGRQKRTVLHHGSNLTALVSWAEGARDGTWQKLSVKVYDFDGAEAVLTRSKIGVYEDIILSDGTMSLNTI